MPKILICDPLPDEGLAILQSLEGVELDKRTGLKGDALRSALAEADGCIVRSGTTLTADVLKGQSRLKVIVRAGVGVDNIDVPAASRAGIVVMNTPGGNTLSTAEQTIALLLAMSRHIPAADASMKAGRWDRKSFVGTQLAGKTIGIIGLGRVGLAVAKRALGLEMKVVGFDPFLSPERASQLGIQSVGSLDELYPRVQFLTVHVPSSDETKSMIGSKELAMLPKGSFVINCARGGIVDESALAEALSSGHLAGAAVDVYSEEPPPKDMSLLKLPNVVLTPHLGASTAEAQLNVAIEAAQLMSEFFSTGSVRFAVNMANIDQAEFKEVARFFDIAWRLGQLQAQVARGTIKRASIQYLGDAGKRSTRLLTAGFAMGLLQKHLEQEVNPVNAQILAAERGIQIDEIISSETTDFSSLIRTDVETDRETFVAAGTTRGDKYCRLIRLGPYRLDAFLDGTMLVYHHQDKPGVIGLIGTVFGKAGVNIASMVVGRKEAGGSAIGVLALDNDPPESALKEIRADSRVDSVQVVKLPPLGEMPRGFG